MVKFVLLWRMLVNVKGSGVLEEKESGVLVEEKGSGVLVNVEVKGSGVLVEEKGCGVLEWDCGVLRMLERTRVAVEGVYWVYEEEKFGLIL